VWNLPSEIAEPLRRRLNHALRIWALRQRAESRVLLSDLELEALANDIEDVFSLVWREHCSPKGVPPSSAHET
jgi:hypothetical protein